MDESVKRNGIIAIAVLLVVVAAVRLWTTFGGDKVAKAANTVTYICAETGQVFEIELTAGMPGPPQENPKTGNKTLWPAEMCYWNECGPRGGTAVLMNTFLDEPEPTHCPMCGQIVRFRNPKPPGFKPPED